MAGIAYVVRGLEQDNPVMKDTPWLTRLAKFRCNYFFARCSVSTRLSRYYSILTVFQPHASKDALFLPLDSWRQRPKRRKVYRNA